MPKEKFFALLRRRSSELFNQPKKFSSRRSYINYFSQLASAIKHFTDAKLVHKDLKSKIPV
jgi:hypothetical protein